METNENENPCPTCECHGRTTSPQKMQLIRTGKELPTGSPVDLRILGPDWQVRGDRIPYLDSRTFVENVSVFHNGVLQLSGLCFEDEKADVYFLGEPGQMAFRLSIKTGDVVHVQSDRISSHPIRA